MSLYRQLLGREFERLPLSVQQMHEPRPMLRASGLCSVHRGRSLLVPLVAWLMGFPRAAERLPLRFEMEARDGVEHWRRHFGETKLFSVFRARDGHLLERMGPMLLEQDLQLNPDGLHLVFRRGWFLGIPLPGFLTPKVRAVAGEEIAAEGARYTFDVQAALPFIGLVVHYRGWLKREPTT